MNSMQRNESRSAGRVGGATHPTTTGERRERKHSLGRSRGLRLRDQRRASSRHLAALHPESGWVRSSADGSVFRDSDAADSGNDSATRGRPAAAARQLGRIFRSDELTTSTAESGMSNTRRTSRRPVFGGCAEHVGAQVVARHGAAGGGFDGDAAVSRNLPAHQPVAHDGLPAAQKGCELDDATCVFDCVLEGVHAH